MVWKWRSKKKKAVTEKKKGGGFSFGKKKVGPQDVMLFSKQFASKFNRLGI